MLLDGRMEELRLFLASWAREKEGVGLKWQHSSADIRFGKRVVAQFKHAECDAGKTIKVLAAEAATNAAFKKWITETSFERLQEVIKFQFFFPR